MDDLFAEAEAEAAPSPPPGEDLLAPALPLAKAALPPPPAGDLLAKAPPPAEEAAPSPPPAAAGAEDDLLRAAPAPQPPANDKLETSPPAPAEPPAESSHATPRTEPGHQTSHEGVTDKGGGARRKNARTKAKGEPASCSSCAGSATARGGVESARPARIEINMTWSVGRRDTVASSCM